MPDFDELRREEYRLEKLKFLVDGLCREIVRGKISWEEAARKAEVVREQAKTIVPESMELYDLIYVSRIKRFMEQFLRR